MFLEKGIGTFTIGIKLIHEIGVRKDGCKEFSQINIILVDDIITTGLTLSEACNTLTCKGKEVLFCLTLADAHK